MSSGYNAWSEAKDILLASIGALVLGLALGHYLAWELGKRLGYTEHQEDCICKETPHGTTSD